MMIELRRGFMQTSKYIRQLESVQGKLSQRSQDENTLATELAERKVQYDSLAEQKASIEQTLAATEQTLAEAQENLDGTSRRETELRGNLEKVHLPSALCTAALHFVL